jgi:NADH-quinone oxidoreductase subunit L
VTAGFYSKDLILWQAWSSEQGSPVLLVAGLVGALLTSLYIFRLIFLAFHGEERTAPKGRPGPRIAIPLVVLALLSIVGGFVEVPASLGGFHGFTHFVDPAVPPATGEHHGSVAAELALQGVALLAVAVGFALAWAWFLRGKRAADGSLRAPAVPAALHRFWAGGWGFDTLYDRLLVRPVVAVARAGRSDVFDLPYRFAAAVARGANVVIRSTQTGQLRWYAAGLAVGAVVLVAMAVWR